MTYMSGGGVPRDAANGFVIGYGLAPVRRHGMIAVCSLVLAATLGMAGLRMFARHPEAVRVLQPKVAAAAAVPPAATVKAIPQASIIVQNVLEQWAKDHPGHRWSVAVSGLRGDQTVAALNENAEGDMASLYKLLILYPLVKKVPRAQWGSIQVTTTAGKQSLEACVRAMILVSDNPCGEAVATYVGWVKADRLLAGLGLTETYLDRGTTGTARDVNSYLARLESGRLFGEEDTAYFKSLMSQQHYRAGIPAGCSGCQVYDKTGDTGAVRNDAALIRLADGRTYSLVVMTDGAGYADIAKLTAAVNAAMRQ